MYDTDKAKQLKDEGNVLFRKEQYESALEYYERAIAVNSNLKEAWFNKGMVYAQFV